MKAALVLFDWFDHGGLQRDCRRIGESLVKKGADVSIICMHFDGDIPAGFSRISPALPAGSKVARRKAFAAFLAQHIKDVDYDVVCGFNRVPGLDYYFAADTCFAWKAYQERNWFYRFSSRSRQYLAFEKEVFGQGSKTQVLMLSPMQRKEYLACYPHAKNRIHDIAPGIARDRMAGDDAAELRESLRSEFGIGGDDLLLLQIGTGYPIKGVDRSLKAIAALPDSLKKRVHYLLLGEDRKGRYTAMAAKMSISDRINIIGGRNDMPRFLQGADIMLQPSRKESAGMVILESIVAGLPVLTTETCGYAFHVDASQAGEVVKEPYTQQAMNSCLIGMLDQIGADGGRRWKTNGIAYGEQGDFYDMPVQVADMLLMHGDSSHAG